MGKKKYILAVAGIMGSIIGISAAVPAFGREQYTLAVLGSMLMTGGLVLIAIAFGEDEENQTTHRKKHS